MGLSLTHRIGEGARITGRGRVIDVIVRNTGGKVGRRRTVLEIRGIPGTSWLEITGDQIAYLTEEINVKINNRNRRVATNRIPLSYVAPSDFLILRRDYS